MTDIETFFILLNNIVSVIIIIVSILIFVFRHWIKEKITNYFKMQLSKETESYKHELIKGLELYKAGLLKEMELLRIDIENKKYITKKVIDKRMEAYELIVSLMNKVAIDIHTYSESGDNPEIQEFLKRSLRKNIDLLREAIQNYSFFMNKEIDAQVAKLNYDMLNSDWRDTSEAKKILEQFGLLREVLKRDMLVTEDFSSLDKKIQEKYT